MKFDFLKNKVFIISFIVLILFSFFNCNVFADTSFDPNYDYIYHFKIDNSKTFPLGLHPWSHNLMNPSLSDFNNIINSYNHKDSIVSGDNFFFIYPNNSGIVSFEINKSDIQDVFITYKNLNYFSTSEFGDIHNVFYSFTIVDNSGTSKQFEDINFSLDFDNKCLSTYFYTNYDNPISVHYQNSDKGFGDFFLVAPTITLKMAVGQIPEIMTKIVKQVLPIGLIVLVVGLIIYLIRHVIYSMK